VFQESVAILIVHLDVLLVGSEAAKRKVSVRVINCIIVTY
jgi:hypothetical protein